MQKENVVLMKEARETLAGKWGLAVGVCFLYMLIAIVAGSPDDIIGPILSLIVSGPLLVGLATFSLAISRRQEAEISQLFIGFKDFLRSFVAYILMNLFIAAWTLLLIVPGIIAALSYSLTFFILVDDKSITAGNAIKKSKALMNGNKKKLFYLCLRFFGWAILAVLTAGIGFLWLIPYIYVTMAKFYDDVSGASAAPVSEISG